VAVCDDTYLVPRQNGAFLQTRPIEELLYIYFVEGGHCEFPSHRCPEQSKLYASLLHLR
jgi:hypothetical protein